MWRRLAVWVAPSLLGILVIGSGSAAADSAAQARHASAVRAAQARQLAQQTAAQRLEMLALQKTTNDLTAAQQQRDQLQAKANDLQGQVDKLKDQVAALQAASVGLGSGPAARTVGVTAGPNHFAFGYCTYYVASKRYIPWLGNAGTWLWSAQAYGWPTGHTPRVGAIEVAALSIWGHVAWVESVNSDGTYWVTEANYYAWNYVDRRLVIPSLEHLIGYIY